MTELCYFFIIYSYHHLCQFLPIFLKRNKIFALTVAKYMRTKQHWQKPTCKIPSRFRDFLTLFNNETRNQTWEWYYKNNRYIFRIWSLYYMARISYLFFFFIWMTKKINKFCTQIYFFRIWLSTFYQTSRWFDVFLGFLLLCKFLRSAQLS